MARIREHGALAGLAINPKTPVESLESFLDAFDVALVMSVEPGFGGQKFMPSALDKLRWLKSRLKPGTFASVDGGIDLETIGDVAAAGANIFVTGMRDLRGRRLRPRHDRIGRPGQSRRGRQASLRNPPSMPDVVLIRPGCTDFDEQNRIQGVLDLPLNHRGHAQVLGLVAQLQEVEFDVVFTAPGEPARSTALAICEQNGASLKEVDDFRNLDHGLWQGLPVDDVRRKYPKVFKQWQESPETVRLPEGETVAEAVERIRRGLRKCLEAQTHDRYRGVGATGDDDQLRATRPAPVVPGIVRPQVAAADNRADLASHGRAARSRLGSVERKDRDRSSRRRLADQRQADQWQVTRQRCAVSERYRVSERAPPTNAAPSANGRSVTLPKSRKDNGNGKDAGNGNGTSSAAGTGPASTSKRGTHE